MSEVRCVPEYESEVRCIPEQEHIDTYKQTTEEEGACVSAPAPAPAPPYPHSQTDNRGGRGLSSCVSTWFRILGFRVYQHLPANVAAPPRQQIARHVSVGA